MTSMRAVVFLFSLILTAPLTHAFMVTIEPDDYADGTDLSHVSPYVTLQSVSPWGNGAVLADSTRPMGQGGPAPTGNQTFGNHGFGLACCGGGSADIDNYMGFGMFFHQAVDRVSLLGTSWYWQDLDAGWAAFDQAGNLIETGIFGPNSLGESFAMDIEVDGLWTLLVGGASGIAAVEFDRLAFEVPEPGPLALLTLALAGLVATRRYAITQALA